MMRQSFATHRHPHKQIYVMSGTFLHGNTHVPNCLSDQDAAVCPPSISQALWKHDGAEFVPRLSLPARTRQSVEIPSRVDRRGRERSGRRRSHLIGSPWCWEAIGLRWCACHHYGYLSYSQLSHGAQVVRGKDWMERDELEDVGERDVELVGIQRHIPFCSDVCCQKITQEVSTAQLFQDSRTICSVKSGVPLLYIHFLWDCILVSFLNQ